MSDNQIIKNVVISLSNITNTQELENLKSSYLSKNGIITSQLRNLAKLEISERKVQGQAINAIKQQLEHLFLQKETALSKQAMDIALKKETLDITIPARKRYSGSIHPISQALDELITIFAKFNFTIAEGPNIENEWYNFSALNINEDHPARQTHDTFYLANGKLLRTHTSPIQIRAMESQSLPIRIIAPGRTYRSDFDMTHTPMFHQIEGLVVDENVNMGHLKYLIHNFIKMFFEQEEIEIIFRPSFFPFTTPSAEIDIKRSKTDKWLEVLGCGMVHPNVLNNVGINPKKYQGFAFGLGVERLAMLKYGISDLRQFFEGDQRWLSHYSFSAFDIPNIVGGITR